MAAHCCVYRSHIPFPYFLFVIFFFFVRHSAFLSVSSFIVRYEDRGEKIAATTTTTAAGALFLRLIAVA